MSFFTDVRFPSSQVTVTSTTTVFLGLTISPPAHNVRVCITGISFFYAAGLTGVTVQPSIMERTSNSPNGTTTFTLVVHRLPSIVSSTAITYFSPITGSFGGTLRIGTTTTAGAQTEIDVLYYYDGA